MEPGYWAVIPAAVRYSAEIPAGAKLLYAEISSLTDQRGYCFASNAYFADLYGVGIRTIQRYLDALKAAGLIRITDGEGGSDQRKIYAGVNPLAAEPATEMTPPHDKNVMGPATELSCPHDKNVAANLNNKKENKKEEHIPPVSPKEKTPLPNEIADRIEAYSGADLKLRDALLHFALNRQAIRKPIKTQHAMTLLLSKLDRLSEGDCDLKIELLNEAEEHNWLSVFRHDDRRSPTRTVEAPAEVAAW